MPDEEMGTKPEIAEGQPPEAQGQSKAVPEVTPETPVDVSSLPVNVQNLIRSTREDAAKNRKHAETLQAEADKQKESALEEQQKWEELAQQRGQKLDELSGVTEQRDTYKQRLIVSLQSQIEDWPEEFKGMLPETDDPEVLQSFIDKAKPAVLKFIDKTPVPGIGSTPRPVGQHGQLSPEQEKERKASFNSWVRNL